MSDGLTINMETKEALHSINRLLTTVERPKALLKSIQRYIKAVTNMMFTGKRPDTSGGKRGITWKSLEPSTIEQKIALAKRGKLYGTGNPRRPMIRTGKTRDSHKVLEENPKGFVYGTRVRSKTGFPYAAYHNSRHFTWLFLTNKDLAQMVQMTRDFLINKLKSPRRYVKK